MLVYAEELLHSFQCLLFLLVLLLFFFFTCLFICLFFYLRVLPDRMLCLEPWLEHFSNEPFFFSHLNHTGVVNAVDPTIRVAGMLDLFLHVFVDNQSKRRLFKFWKKKNFVEISVIVLKRSFLTVGRNCTVMRPIIPSKKNNDQRTNSWQEQSFHFLSIIVWWLNLINWQFLKFTRLCSKNRCPSWIHFSDPKMNWHYMLTQIYVDLLIFCNDAASRW